VTTQIIDSPRRCPRDGKRMAMEIGQHSSAGDIRIEHQCWHCGYTEEQNNWSRRLRTDGFAAAQRRLAKLRGVEIPLAKDTTPFPEEQW